METTIQIKVRGYHVDHFGHVNNGKYFDFFEEGRWGYFDNKRDLIDYFHLNTITVLPQTPLGQSDHRFREDNLLVCFRNVNQVAVLEKGTYRVLWSWGEGQLQWPHHPTMLENGHILIFDNGIARKYSRVIELDPVTKRIVWEYRTTFPEDFYSEARGSAQRLPNGNTLICESDLGRVFEVTPEGEIVWLWFNPGTREGRRLTVYRMIRLPREMVAPLLERQWWQIWKGIEDFRLRILD